MTTQGQWFRFGWSLLAAFFLASALEPSWGHNTAAAFQYLISFVASGQWFGVPPSGFFFAAAAFSGLMALGYI